MKWFLYSCDGNTEKKCKINKWNLPFTKKQKPGSKTCFEGTVLNIEFIDQMKPVIEFLRKEESKFQLFRLQFILLTFILLKLTLSSLNSYKEAKRSAPILLLLVF